MSKTYEVIFTVVAPEGWDKFGFDPYPFDNVFDDLGAEIVNIVIEEEK